MKFIYLQILFLGVSFLAHAQELSDFEINSLKNEISYENLKKVYEDDDLSVKRLDRVLNIYVNVVKKIMETLEAKNDRGKSYSQAEKEFLVYLVEQTQVFTEKFNGGNIHHYIFSKLYAADPQQMSVAIARSNLTASEKTALRSSIRANLETEG